jgi:hypothetical protein
LKLLRLRLLRLLRLTLLLRPLRLLLTQLLLLRLLLRLLRRLPTLLLLPLRLLRSNQLQAIENRPSGRFFFAWRFCIVRGLKQRHSRESGNPY